MKNSSRPQLHTRRAFLRSTLLGGAATFTVPAFLDQTFLALQAQAAGPVQPTTGQDGRILVVLQLAGGNDGLNTVVPYADDAYHRARPRLGIGQKEVLRIDDHIGFNPLLENFHRLLGEGQLGVVQGVGYPNPNRSHFRSTEIWATATDADRTARHGWLGRYFDAACSGEESSAGVALAGQTPQAFHGPGSHTISFKDPHQFRFEAGGAADPEALEEMVAQFGGASGSPGGEGESGSTIGMLAGGGMSGGGEGDVLDFLRRTSLDAQVASEEVERLAAAAGGGDYPASRLARDLRFVARMIEGGMPTRVYYVSQGGFDTHANQQPTHQRLMTELDGAIGAFVKDLGAQGNLDRVLLMTFSEFGRRVTENGGGGTDHGAAAPLFLVGGATRPGIHGKHPSLTDLNRGDLIHSVDFRSVYATVLEEWLGTNSSAVLGRGFAKLGVLA